VRIVIDTDDHPAPASLVRQLEQLMAAVCPEATVTVLAER
jgi:hypothetical protein